MLKPQLLLNFLRPSACRMTESQEVSQWPDETGVERLNSTVSLSLLSIIKNLITKKKDSFPCLNSMRKKEKGDYGSKRKGRKNREDKTEKEKVRPTANQWTIKTLMLRAN